MHVHHDLIVAWAKGATIQYLNKVCNEWCDACSSPFWEPKVTYRIKPEPKPDVVLYACIEKEVSFDNKVRIGFTCADKNKQKTDTCMFIFDGETGKLKDAQVIASSNE
jgi:hypothetical protein